MKKLLFLFCVVLTASIHAQTVVRDVVVNSSGELVAPLNLWTANANAISGALSLGTAAQANVGDFATALQGTKADDSWDRFTSWGVKIGVGASYGGTPENGDGSPIAIGNNAFAYDGGVAVGYSASAGFFSVQLGTGTNNIGNTLQVFSYQMMDSSGRIPNARMPSDLSITGNTTLGDASGDTLTVNAGTLNAPNATSTDSTRLANVGTLDARYAPKKYIVHKTSFTSRNSTATPAVDPELKFTSVDVGRYRVEIMLWVYGDTNTGGFKWAIEGTAVMSANYATCTPSLGSDMSANARLSAPLSGQDIAAWSNSRRGSIIVFTVNVTTAGSVNFNWSQSSSDTGNATLKAGSYMIFEKIN